MAELAVWVAVGAVAASVLFILTRYWNDLFYGSQKNLPPGSFGWPVVGESTELFKDFAAGGKPNQFLNRRYDLYGKVAAYKTHLLGGPTIVLPTYEGIKFVLSSADKFRLGLPSAEQILGEGAFALQTGARRKRFREILMDALAGPEALKSVIPIMDRQTKELLKEAASKDSFDFFELCKALTQRSEMEIFFGSFDHDAFLLFGDVFNKFVGGLFGFPINFPGFARYGAIQGRHRVQRWLQTRIDERRAAKSVHSDAMSYLMETVDENGQKLPDDIITLSLFNFFTGSQSTFRPLFWVVYYLSKHPQYIQELKDEHQNLADEKNGEMLTKDDMRKMPYTQKVFDETLRLLNLFPWLFRKANVDVDFHGITIPKDWKALAFLRALHMDPDNYPDPETFNPHRWNDPKTLKAPFAPFGHGQRHCPGKTQATFQTCLLLHNLTLNYKWPEFLVPDSPVRYMPEAKPANCMARLTPLT